MKAPPGARPLTDRVREALFNILRDRVSGAVFLDLFAGSGAVAIEALSRGAERAVLIDSDRRAVSIIRENLATCGLTDRAEIFALLAERGLNLLVKRGRKFDLVFLGAPYDSPALIAALEKLGAGEILAKNAVVIGEHRKQHWLDDRYGGLRKFREARYGETVLNFYENSSLPR